MSYWRKLRNTCLAYCRRSTWEEKLTTVETKALCDELEALLDLSCYAAAQAVAFSKRLEHQLSTMETTCPQQETAVAHEYHALQTRLGHLRETIESLHVVLRSARTQQALNGSRREWELASQMVAEIVTAGDLCELKESLQNLDGKFARSEP